MSGGGSVALGSSVTLTNAGVTSIVAGSGISISGATGAVTVTASGGGVTSAVAGNGVAVSGATGSVTFSAACPSFNSIGSYAYAMTNGNGAQVSATMTAGSNYSAGGGQNQVSTISALYNNDTTNYTALYGGTTALSGTWKWMGGSVSIISGFWPSAIAIACRVS
jgi:hypothetical protein